METTKKTQATILVVIIKIGAKVLPKLLKVAKGLFSLKAVGVAASAGLYSYLLTWQMGCALVAFIAWHEYGHLSAMKKCGIKTMGIYLIPGFGGAAMAAEGFKSGRNESYIALMGPVYGVLFIFIAIGVYFYTGDKLFLSIASMMTFINLINLFPINPLDGGRVVKSLVYSFRESYGFFFMLFSFALAAVISGIYGWHLLTLVAFIGLSEVFSDYGLSEALSTLTRTIFRMFMAVIFIWFVVPELTAISFSVAPLKAVIFSSVAMLMFGALWCDIHLVALRYEKRPWYYPQYVIYEIYFGIKQLFSLKEADLIRIDGHVPMVKKDVVKYSLLYLFVTLFHIALMLGISLLPGMAEVGHLLS
jgi:Zn-dependent protease